MVGQSGRDQSDNQQGWKFCDSHFQSGAALATVAGRRCCGPTAPGPCRSISKPRRCAESEFSEFTEIASQRAAGIATIPTADSISGLDSFSGLKSDAYAWHDSTESKKVEGSRQRCPQALGLQPLPCGPSH